MAGTAQALAAAPAPEPEAWDLSCPDWEQRLAEGRSLVPSLPLDRARADRAVAVFKKLRIPDVDGTPKLADAADDWIFDIVAAIFGAFDTATSIRMIRALFLLVPKKNAKTTYGAAIVLTAAILNERPRAELILTAPSIEITDKSFSQAAGMVELDDEGYLQKRFHVRDHIKTIEDRRTKAKTKIKTFDKSIVTGAVPTFALIDEVHLLGTDPDAEAIVGQLKGGMVSVPNAFLGMITTQSFKEPAGVFKSELKIARAIRDGRARGIDTLAVLYEFSEAQQKNRKFWENPDHWRRILPNEGRSVFVRTLVKDWAAAQLKDEGVQRIWASQHLNVQVGLALHEDRWTGADHWEAAEEAGLTLDALLDRCEVVVMGGDGGGLDDLLGLAVLGREKDTGRWLLWNRAWCFEKVLERREEIAPKLQDLKAAGELTICETLGQDMEELEALARKVVESGKLPEKAAIGVDRAGIAEVVAAFRRAGVAEDQIVGIAQGWSLSGAIGSTERALADGTLRHAGQGLMTWCVGNAKSQMSGNAVVITKQTAGKAKIDPLMATFDAVTLMARNPKASRSMYDDDGAADEAAGEQLDADDDTKWDPAVIADPRHPQFAEHKRRFEAWQDAQGGEE